MQADAGGYSFATNNLGDLFMSQTLKTGQDEDFFF